MAPLRPQAHLVSRLLLSFVLVCFEIKSKIKREMYCSSSSSQGGPRISPVQADKQPVFLFLAALVFQVSKDLGEIVRIRVDL